MMRVHLTHFSKHVHPQPVLLETLVWNERRHTNELPWQGLNIEPVVPPLRGPAALGAHALLAALGPKRCREEITANWHSPDIEIEPMVSEIM